MKFYGTEVHGIMPALIEMRLPMSKNYEDVKSKVDSTIFNDTCIIGKQDMRVAKNLEKADEKSGGTPNSKFLQMSLQKVKSALIKANKAEERFHIAESELFIECQKLCNYPLDFCQYQPSDGFCLVFDTDKVKDVDISVKSFVDLVSKLKRKLELEDIISIF